MQLHDRVDPTHTALLVIDVQNDFCHPDGHHSCRGADLSTTDSMLPKLEQLIYQARKFGVKPIFIYASHDDWTNSKSWLDRNNPNGNCAPGSWGMDTYRLQVTEKDGRVIKHRYNAFIGTELDMILRSNEIQNVIVTGVATDVCVDSTARHASMIDYFVTVPKDCCATFSPQRDHEAALRLLEDRFAMITTSDDIIETWVK